MWSRTYSRLNAFSKLLDRRIVRRTSVTCRSKRKDLRIKHHLLNSLFLFSAENIFTDWINLNTVYETLKLFFVGRWGGVHPYPTLSTFTKVETQIQEFGQVIKSMIQICFLMNKKNSLVFKIINQILLLHDDEPWHCSRLKANVSIKGYDDCYHTIK